MKECSDQELIEKLIKGEDLALNEIMGRYKHRLYGFIRRYLGDDELAYDLVQETFTKIYFSASTYNPKYKFSSWLFQIALNLCRDHNRKNKLRKFFSFDEGEEILNIADVAPDPESLAESDQAVTYIGYAIESLPHKLKTALILFALEGNNQEECAEILNVTPKTVETRVYRARKLLSDKLSKLFEG